MPCTSGTLLHSLLEPPRHCAQRLLAAALRAFRLSGSSSSPAASRPHIPAFVHTASLSLLPGRLHVTALTCPQLSCGGIQLAPRVIIITPTVVISLQVCGKRPKNTPRSFHAASRKAAPNPKASAVPPTVSRGPKAKEPNRVVSRGPRRRVTTQSHRWDGALSHTAAARAPALTAAATPRQRARPSSPECRACRAAPTVLPPDSRR